MLEIRNAGDSPARVKSKKGSYLVVLPHTTRTVHEDVLDKSVLKELCSKGLESCYVRHNNKKWVPHSKAKQKESRPKRAPKKKENDSADDSQ